MNAMRQAHADGWFIVFDTLTLTDDRLEAFYDKPNALRDYFRDVSCASTAYTGSVDPNFGRRVRSRRQLGSLQTTWPYGYSMPIAVRYTQDAFSRSGWLWPVDAKGEPLKATSYMAVG